MTAAALRDYQSLAVELTEAAITRGDNRLYFALPTGTGKTVVLGELALNALPGRVLALVHTRELVSQLAAGLQRSTGHHVGIVMAGADEPAAGIVVGSVQTLRGSRLEAVLDAGPIALLLIDECHHVTSSAYRRLIEAVEQRSPGVVVVGCSATPWRADRQRMTDVLPRCVFDRSIAEMARAGWLAPLIWQRVELDRLDLTSVPTSRAGGETDYHPQELAEVMNAAAVVQATVTLTAPLIGDRLTVVFAADVKHAQALARGYQAQGLRAATIWGAMPPADRSQLLDDWRAGRVQVVTSVSTLLEGFDLPELAAAVIARPTQSPGRYVQQIGRVSRIAPGKADALVLDVTGSAFGPGSLDARQITLPLVLGERPPGGLDGSEDVGQPHRALRLLDPVGEAPAEWSRDAATGVYYAGMGENLAAVLIPDPTGSGLFRPAMVPTRGHATVQFLLDHAVPLADAVGSLALTAARNGRLPALTSKRAPWRKTKPSVAQLDFLRALDAPAGAQAVAQGWTAGAVSLAIVGHLVMRRLKPVLRAGLWRDTENEDVS